MTQPPARHARPPTPAEGLLVRARPVIGTGLPQVPRTSLIANNGLLPPEPTAPQLPGDEQETAEIPPGTALPTLGTVTALPQPPEATAGDGLEAKPLTAKAPASTPATASTAADRWVSPHRLPLPAIVSPVP